MNLNQWIDQVSDGKRATRRGIRHVERAAELLGEEVRTVYSWYRQERVPRFPAAMNIVVVSAGAVDYNGIYGPFQRNPESAFGAGHDCV